MCVPMVTVASSPQALAVCRSVHMSPDPPEPETRSFPPGLGPSHRDPPRTWWTRNHRWDNESMKNLRQTGSHWFRLDQTSSEWIKLGQIGPYWDRQGQIVSDWDRMGQTGPDWDRLGQVYLLSEIRPVGWWELKQTETHLLMLALCYMLYCFEWGMLSSETNIRAHFCRLASILS